LSARSEADGEVQPLTLLSNVQAVGSQKFAPALQVRVPVGQDTPQFVPSHVAVPFGTAAQALVHEPQWLGVFSGDSHPGSLVQSPNPVLQETTAQAPVAHVVVACERLQGMPHPPQFAFVLSADSHPSVSTAPVEQFAKPLVQADCGTRHPPEPLHVTGAPDLMCGSAVQSCPQLPQLVGSALVSTHVDVQRSGVGDAQLEEQVGVPLVVEHRPRGAAQAFMQLPQVCGVVKSVSQPSAGFEEQWPCPLTQAAGWITQTPDTH
jgi:hypothetical protein